MARRKSTESIQPIAQDNRTFWGDVFEQMAQPLNRSNRFHAPPERAEDTTQDAFFKAMNGYRGDRAETMRRNWSRGNKTPTQMAVHRVNANVRTDGLRTGRRRDGDVSLDVFTDQESAIGASRHKPAPSVRQPHRDPHESAEHRDDMSAVTKAMARLTDDQRHVLTLTYMEGLSTGEIGQLMGKKNGAVRALRLRGLERLREELKHG